jgi:hypothetical protein
MPSLLELQTAFANALLDPDETGPLAQIVADGIPAAERLAIYRSDIAHNFREALRNVYPVVERLVGEAFFGHAADRYTACHPSRHGNLHAFGEHFGAFLAGFQPAQTLPYLPDVARLEWLIHEVFHAAGHAPLALDRLAGVAAADLPRLRLVLHPACRLLASDYAVHRIWQANQPGAGGDVAGAAEPVHLLLRRKDHAVEMEWVSEAEFRFLAECGSGRTLAAALDEASSPAGELDLPALLARRVGDGTLADFRLPRDENVKARRYRREVRRPDWEPLAGHSDSTDEEAMERPPAQTGYLHSAVGKPRGDLLPDGEPQARGHQQ